MKKILSVFVAVALINTLYAQQPEPTPTKKDWSKVVIDPAGDHFMLQFTGDGWIGAPDSIKNRIKGFSRGFNVSIMLNQPFQSDPRWSAAFGVGIINSNIFFKNTDVNVISNSPRLPFTPTDSTDHFEKYKLATTYLEVPIELRYAFDPVNQKRSWKLALGVKAGTMLNAHNKGKTLENKYNATIGSYTQKESKRTYFNNFRLASTIRAGIGNFSVIGSYSVTALLRDVAGPSIHPWQIGLCISGL
jgi:hypothetical protein